MEKSCGAVVGGVAQWVKRWPADRKVTSSFPGWGTGLGGGPGPRQGAGERQLIDVSLTFQCFSPSLSKSK